MPHMPEERYKCRECSDTNWIDTIDPELNMAAAMKPCRICTPIRYQRWKDGHLASSHKRWQCAYCHGLDTGTITDFDHLPDGTLPIGFLDNPAA